MEICTENITGNIKIRNHIKARAKYIGAAVFIAFILLFFSQTAMAADTLTNLKVMAGNTVLINKIGPLATEPVSVPAGTTLTVSFEVNFSTVGGNVRFANANWPTSPDSTSVTVTDWLVTVDCAAGETLNIPITIQPEGGDDITYNIEAHALSDNALLSALTVTIYGSFGSRGFTDFVFETGQTAFLMEVPNNVTRVVINPVTMNAHAAAAPSGVEVTNFLDDGTVAKFTVTAEDTVTAQEYTVRVIRSKTAPSSNNNLSKVSFYNGSTELTSLSVGSATNYNVTVNAANITLAAIAADGKALIYVEGKEVISGRQTESLSVPSSGNRQIKIQVVAENQSSRNYTLNISRSTGNNANLSGLYVAGNPGGSMRPSTFSSATTVYNYSGVTSSLSSISILPTLEDSAARMTVRINGAGTDYSNGSGAISKPIPLANGVNSSTNIVITVTAADNATIKNYEMTIVKGTPSSNAYLSNIRVSASNSSSASSGIRSYPGFSYNNESYELFVPYGNSTVYVFPTADHSGAKVSVSGVSVNPTGSNSVPVSLSTGYNYFSVQVTAQDGINARSYDLVIRRAPYSASTDATLYNLQPNTTSGDLALSPVFAPGTNTYSLTAANSLSSLRFRPTANNNDALIFINDERTSSGSNRTVTLNALTTTVIVTVMAPDFSTTRNYTVNITRGAPVSANLKSISLRDGTGGTIALSPAFNANTTLYSVNVSGDTASVALRVEPESNNIIMRVNGTLITGNNWTVNMPLAPGNNVFLIETLTPDNSRKYYNVTVAKPSAPTYLPIKLIIGSRTVTQGGKTMTLSASPFFRASGGNNWTMVPIRVITEGMGAVVNYNNATKGIEIILGGKSLRMTLGVRNPAAGLEVAPEAINQTTFVPVRYVSETLGAVVTWTTADQSVIIAP